MKRKISFSITLLLLLSLLLLSLTACEEKECEHSYQGTVTKAATCEEEGIKTFTCSLCDDSYTESIPALGHDEDLNPGKFATCTEIGWDNYITCKREGCTYTTYSEKAALGHFEQTHEAKAPTCTEIGWDAYVTCSRCDYTTYSEKPALEHDLKHTDAKAPTCTEIGWDAYDTCQRDGCEYTTYVEKSALDHDLEHHDAKAPTCTEIGWDAYDTCKRTGCDYTTYTPIEENGHSHDAVVTKPTCTEKGYTTHTCHCGDTYVDTYVDELGHNEVTDEAVAPTCTKTGLTEGSHCSVCNTVLVEQKTVDKLAHDYSEELICNSTHHYYECKCGSRKDEEKHISSGAPTATQDEVCTKCGYVINEAIGISFKTLTVDGNNVFGKVSNDTTYYSFINEINAVGGAKYIVSRNITGTDWLPAKTIDLAIGDNTIYVIEMIDDEPSAIYTVVIRRRPVYTVTFDANGGTSVKTQYVEEEKFAAIPETTYTGYSFTGWNYDFGTPIMSDTHITASWKANTDTKYTVEYYLENLDKSDYELIDTDELTGTTDTTAEALIKEFEHFTFNSKKSIMSGNIDRNGILVLKVYYTRNVYTIKGAVENEKAGTISGSGNYNYDKEVTLKVRTNPGYAFLGWFVGDTLVCETAEFTVTIDKNVTYTAKWEANTNTAYKVEYHLENINKNGYELVETDNLSGTTDTTANAEIKSFKHFAYNASVSSISGNIDGNRTLVLKVYYTRNVYTISSTVENEKAGTTSGSGNYNYDKEITLKASTNPGYTFFGWFDGDTKVCDKPEFTFKSEMNIIYTAKWSLDTDTPYKVEYYLENANDNGYTLHETDNLVGTTESIAKAAIKNFEHFNHNLSESAASGNIKGDGTLILKVYYTRNIYTLSNANTDLGSISASGSYKYGSVDAFEVTATVGKLGYEFIGWYNEETLISADTTYTFTAEMSIEARFAVKQEMANFNFTSTATTCSITGIKNKAVTEIAVPDYVTSISKGSFSGCSNLESLTIPFVGGNKNATYESESTKFGYIFGTYLYTGGVATDQWYETYYIPSLLKNVTVISGNILYGAFEGCTSLTSVTIGNSVTSIGSGAFEGCASLTSVTIGNSVTSIGDYAFRNCTSLTSVTIPDSVTSICDYAFDFCESLTSVTIGNSVTSIGSGAFRYCDSLTSVYITNIAKWCGISFDYSDTNPLYYAENLYFNGKLVTSLIIPDGVTSIGSYAFYNCDSLTSVTIPDSVTSIGNYAFYGCDNLTSVTIGNSVTSIGSSAFYGCYKLVEVINHSSLNITSGSSSHGYVGYYAKEVHTGESKIVNVNDYLFITLGGVNYLLGYVGDETELTLPDDYNGEAYEIYKYAFYNCDSLTSVTIGNSVTSIGDSAFYNCRKLTSVTIGNSVTSIGDYAFRDCTSLTIYCEAASKPSGWSSSWNRSKCPVVWGYTGSIGVTDDGFKWASVTNGIAIYGYSGTNTEIVIPETINGMDVVLISPSAFRGNTTIASVTISDSVTSIGDYAFAYCDSLTGVKIPDSVTSIGYDAFSGCSSLTSVTIGNGVTSIGDSAFYYCYKLVEVINHSSLKINAGISSHGYVGYYAKEVHTGESKIVNVNDYLFITSGGVNYLLGYVGDETELTLPDDYNGEAYEIYKYAFYSCDSLTSVTIGNSVTSIGYDAFSGCSSLTSVTICNGVTSIGDSAFYDCRSLTSIIIPDSVTSIGDYAFLGCTSLTSVTFENPNGWWYSSSSTATSGTNISASNLSNTSTAATYLKSTYSHRYWKRS